MATKFLTGVDLNNQRAKAVGDPTTATDAANKQYVDNKVYGLTWKQPVRAASTTAVTLATTDAGSSFGGVTLAEGDRILVKDQSSAPENGIYVVAADGNAPTRANDADSVAELLGASVFCLEGTNSDKQYVQVEDADTLTTVGTDDVSFVEFGGGTTYSASGQGIELTGTTFSIELDGATLAKSAAGLKLNSSVAGNGLTISGDVLAVNPGTGLQITGDTVAIDSTVVTTPSTVVRKYAAAIGDGSADNFTVNHALGTRDVTVEIYEAATPYTQVFADVEHTDGNNVKVTFPSAPSSGQYRVVVHG